MVSKLEIRKNRVDLLYHQQLQKLNALLIFATTGVLSFVGGILVVPKAFLFGIGIGTMILLASALY